MTVYVQFLAHGRYSGNVSSFPLGGAMHRLGQGHFPLKSSLASDEAESPGLLPPVIGIQEQHSADWADSPQLLAGRAGGRGQVRETEMGTAGTQYSGDFRWHNSPSSPGSLHKEK